MSLRHIENQSETEQDVGREKEWIKGKILKDEEKEIL